MINWTNRKIIEKAFLLSLWDDKHNVNFLSIVSKTFNCVLQCDSWRMSNVVQLYSAIVEFITTVMRNTSVLPSLIFVKEEFWGVNEMLINKATITTSIERRPLSCEQFAWLHEGYWNKCLLEQTTLVTCIFSSINFWEHFEWKQFKIAFWRNTHLYY